MEVFTKITNCHISLVMESYFLFFKILDITLHIEDQNGFFYLIQLNLITEYHGLAPPEVFWIVLDLVVG